MYKYDYRCGLSEDIGLKHGKKPHYNGPKIGEMCCSGGIYKIKKIKLQVCKI